jgi:hypothetical protein
VSSGDKVNSLCPCAGGGEGKRGPLEGVGPENHIKLTTYSTEYRTQNAEYTCRKTHVHKITNVPICLFGPWT